MYWEQEKCNFTKECHFLEEAHLNIEGDMQSKSDKEIKGDKKNVEPSQSCKDAYSVELDWPMAASSSEADHSWKIPVCDRVLYFKSPNLGVLSELLPFSSIGSAV